MTNSRTRGMTIIYLMIGMVLFSGLCSLAVDWGRVTMVKTELQRASDAAAMAGAALLPSGNAAARAEAIKFAAKNKADLKDVTLLSSDVLVGKWNPLTKTLDTTSLNPDAVQVTAVRSTSRGTGVPLTFASLMGMKTADVKASATAIYVTQLDINHEVMAQANPYLSGMPKGTISNPVNPHNNPDYAGGRIVNGKVYPDASPLLVSGLPLVAGSTLQFGSISGVTNNDVNYDPNVNYDPDGNLDWMVDNKYAGGAEHGMSDVWAPINAIIGVFLSDTQPDKVSPPSTLDFRTDASRNFSTLSPKLQQVFFIGDGLDANGKSQQFVVPPGATRFYMAQMDEYEWNNNRGSRTFKITRPGRVVLVK